MDPFKHAKTNPESDSTETSEKIVVNEGGDEALDSETGMVMGKVTEIAHEDASEQTQAGGKKSTAQDDKKAAKPDLSERLALREQLLKAAPKESVMREEVRKVLVQKKEKLEADVAKYSRKRNYHLLSAAIMQLRLVVRQLEELARVGYAALKEVWLKVIHRFA